MKKLVFLFVAFAAISFASCGNKAANNATENDSIAVETLEEAIEEVADSACCGDSTKTCCNDSTKTCCGDSAKIAE